MQLRIKMDKEERLLPTSWESAGALAWKCLRCLARLGPDAGRLEAIRLLCGFSKRQMRGLGHQQLVTLIEGLPWLVIAPIDMPLRPSFYYRGIKYGLPAAKFEDGSAITFALADDFFTAYQEGDDTALVHLLATLARPLRNNNRCALHSRDEVLRRGRRLKRIPPEWLAAAWMYWAGVKAYVHSTYGPWLFQQPDVEVEEDVQPNTSAPQGPNFGWWGKYMDIAESGVFGNIKQVHQSNFHELCIYLVKKEVEYRRQKQELDALRPKKSIA